MNFLNQIFGGLGQKISQSADQASAKAEEAFYVIAGELLVLIVLAGIGIWVAARRK